MKLSTGEGCKELPDAKTLDFVATPRFAGSGTEDQTAALAATGKVKTVSDS